MRYNPRMTHHPTTIAIYLDNPTLHRLIEEQLRANRFAIYSPTNSEPESRTESGADPDCILITNGAAPPSQPHITSHSIILDIPKGAVRLGDIVDKLRYVMSRRDDHLEDELSYMDLGDFTLFPATNLLHHIPSNQDIRLTDKERLLLRVLYEAGPAGLPRRDVLKAVWGYADDAETHTIETHIYRLRQKLEPYQGHNLIKAQDGRYLLDMKKPA